MTICLEDRLCRFAQVVKLAELVRDTRKHRCHGRPNRLLPVRNDATNRHWQSLFDFPQQRHEIPLRCTQEAARKQHLPGEAITNHPEHFVAAVRLETVECQDHLALCGEECPEPLVVGETEGDEFLVALDKVGDRAFRERNATGEQVLVDFGHTAMLGIAEFADERNDIEAEFAMREGPGTFFLGSIGLMKAGATWSNAATYVERQAVDSRQHGNGALPVVDSPERSIAVGTAPTYWLKQLLMRGGRATGTACHNTPPTIYVNKGSILSFQARVYILH